jgi:hypothetical protein
MMQRFPTKAIHGQIQNKESTVTLIEMGSQTNEKLNLELILNGLTQTMMD